MAVLLTLRRRLVKEHGAETAAELMMVDTVVLAYYHQMRVTGWIGDFAQWLESEFFGGAASPRGRTRWAKANQA